MVIQGVRERVKRCLEEKMNVSTSRTLRHLRIIFRSIRKIYMKCWTLTLTALCLSLRWRVKPITESFGVALEVPNECRVQCKNDPSQAQSAAAIAEGFRLVQSSVLTFLALRSEATFPILQLGLMGSGLLDGLAGAPMPFQRFFTGSGLSQPVSEASDSLICKSKDFFGEFFSGHWDSDKVLAQNALFAQEWSEWNRTLVIRRCLNESDTGGERRSRECFRVTNEFYSSPQCEGYKQAQVDTGVAGCSLQYANLQEDLECPFMPRGVCGGEKTQRKCYNVYTMADMGFYACRSWRSVSKQLLAWPADGGLESATLYARSALFSLLMAHTMLLTGTLNQQGIEQIQLELQRAASWMTTSLGQFQSEARQRELIQATSIRSNAQIMDYLDNDGEFYWGSKGYRCCGKKATANRKYRHFMGYGCPARAAGPVYTDLPRYAVVGFIQPGDGGWCQSANCSLLESPRPPMPQCEARRIIYGSGVFATAPYMSDIEGSACRALFSGLKTPPRWGNECNSMKLRPPYDLEANPLNDVSDPLNCTYLASHCQYYLSSLWNAHFEKVEARLSGLMTVMLSDYQSVADSIASLAITNYSLIVGLALKKNMWPAPLA
jgi:hypothetical protein